MLLEVRSLQGIGVNLHAELREGGLFGLQQFVEGRCAALPVPPSHRLRKPVW